MRADGQPYQRRKIHACMRMRARGAVTVIHAALRIIMPSQATTASPSSWADLLPDFPQGLDVGAVMSDVGSAGSTMPTGCRSRHWVCQPAHSGAPWGLHNKDEQITRLWGSVVICQLDSLPTC